MGNSIRDGSGKGYEAKVTKNNRLNISARVANRIFYNSRDDEKTFTVNAAHEQLVGGIAEGMCYIKYTGNNKLYLKQILFNSEETAGVTSPVRFGLWLDPTTIGGGTTRAAVNLNTTSNLISDTAMVHQNNATTGVTITGGDPIGTIRIGGIGNYTYDLFGSVILGKDNVFALKVRTENSGVSTRATIMWYEEE